MAFLKFLRRSRDTFSFILCLIAFAYLAQIGVWGGRASWDTGKEKHMNRDEQKDTPILLISAAAPQLLLPLPITSWVGRRIVHAQVRHRRLRFFFLFHLLEDVLLKTFP